MSRTESTPCDWRRRPQVRAHAIGDDQHQPFFAELKVGEVNRRVCPSVRSRFVFGSSRTRNGPRFRAARDLRRILHGVQQS